MNNKFVKFVTIEMVLAGFLIIGAELYGQRDAVTQDAQPHLATEGVLPIVTTPYPQAIGGENCIPTSDGKCKEISQASPTYGGLAIELETNPNTREFLAKWIEDNCSIANGITPKIYCSHEPAKKISLGDFPVGNGYGVCAGGCMNKESEIKGPSTSIPGHIYYVVDSKDFLNVGDCAFMNSSYDLVKAPCDITVIIHH